VFPAAARPWVRHDPRSAPATPSSPAPAQPTTARSHPGLLAPIAERTGQTVRPFPVARRGLAVGPGPAAGQGREDRVRGPAEDRRHPPAALPAGSRPSCPAPDRLDFRPRATGRYGPVPVLQETENGPGSGPGAGRAPRREHACLLAARCMARRVCHGRAHPACHRIVRYYRNPDFGAFFHALPEIGSEKQGHGVRGESTKMSVGPPACPSCARTPSPPPPGSRLCDSASSPKQSQEPTAGCREITRTIPTSPSGRACRRSESSRTLLVTISDHVPGSLSQMVRHRRDGWQPVSCGILSGHQA
jgi:hypothetical protein